MQSVGSWLAALSGAVLCFAGCGGDAGPEQMPDAGPEQMPDAGPEQGSDICGEPCGECNAGSWACFDATDTAPECVYRSAQLRLKLGLPPADTGNRQRFFVTDFAGEPWQQIASAGHAASMVGGAVILDRIYEIDRTVTLFPGVLYTGGGLRRARTPAGQVVDAAGAGDRCLTLDSIEGYTLIGGLRVVADDSYAGNLGALSPASIDVETNRICSDSPLGFAVPIGARVIRAYHMARPQQTYTDGIIIDSVLFDGAERCNSYTHDWRLNNTLPIRGANHVRNSVFYDIPSENLTICGGLFTGNIAVDLEGSFVHKSCTAANAARDTLTDNYVERANQSGDAVMQHSEGVFTFSANAGDDRLAGNVFRYGGEGVFGLAGPDDEGVIADGDCYAHFPRLIQTYNGADEDAFQFNDVTLIDVGGR